MSPNLELVCSWGRRWTIRFWSQNVKG